jgi:hypothetical protein
MSAEIEELKVKSIAPKKTFADMFENTPSSSKRHIGGDNGGDNNLGSPQVKRNWELVLPQAEL